MKKQLQVVLIVAIISSLSGCGGDSGPGLPTKAAITFAVMSSSITPQFRAASSKTGAQYIYVAASVPGFTHISSTTAPWPSSGVAGLPLPVSNINFLPPAGVTRISGSALAKVGSFANNSSVAKRTKITGYFTNDPFQNGKNINIFLVYSSPRTPGAVTVTGNSIDFARLTVSFPAGAVSSGDVFKEIQIQGLWQPDESNPAGGLWAFFNAAALPTDTVPTISQVILGY